VESPDGFDARRPTIDDLDAIWRLTRACDVAVLGFSDWSADEVREQLESPRGPAATHHWIVTDRGSHGEECAEGGESGRIVGWVWATDQSSGAVDVDWYVEPSLGLNPYYPVAGWLT